MTYKAYQLDHYGAMIDLEILRGTKEVSLWLQRIKYKQVILIDEKENKRYGFRLNNNHYEWETIKE